VSIRTQEDSDRFRLALVPVDQAMWDSEQKWGVGRLERLISQPTLAAYQRGWSAWRAAIEAGDAAAAERVGPKMVAALAVMDREAAAVGHRPLAPDSWECPLGSDGTVLVLVRTQAEQAAVVRSSRANAFTAGPGGGLRAASAGEGGLPPDLTVTVREQHEGRALEVWTMGEVAALILAHGSVARDGRKWEGTAAVSGTVGREGDAADIARSGYPMAEPLAEPVRVPALLDF